MAYICKKTKNEVQLVHQKSQAMTWPDIAWNTDVCLHNEANHSWLSDYLDMLKQTKTMNFAQCSSRVRRANQNRGFAGV